MLFHRRLSQHVSQSIAVSTVDDAPPTTVRKLAGVRLVARRSWRIMLRPMDSPVSRVCPLSR
jgi:hypothetical protein